MKIEKLRPLEKNPFRGKGDKQLKLIAESIAEFEKMMTIRKIVIDENFEILGGNKRYFALKMLGKTEIPDTWIDQRTDLTEAEKREYYENIITPIMERGLRRAIGGVRRGELRKVPQIKNNEKTA